MRLNLKGLVAATFTPFLPDGSLNLAAIAGNVYERIVAGNDVRISGRVDAEDFALQLCQILGQRCVDGVADADFELALFAKIAPAFVVIGRRL